MATNGNDLLFGGIRAMNLDKLDAKFICQFCKLILYQPWQLLCCGALFCKWCVKNGLSGREPFICEYCHAKQARKEALADLGVERELKLVIITCYACSWEGTYLTYLNHLQEEHADFECVDCHAHFLCINALEEHRKELCIQRRLPCGLPNCMDSIKWDEMEAHLLSYQHQRILMSVAGELIHPPMRQLQSENYSEIITKEINNIQESIDIGLSSFETLSDDLVRVRDERNQLETRFQESFIKIDELKKYENENRKSVEDLLQLQSSVEREMDDIKKVQEESQIQMLELNLTTTFRFNVPTTPIFSLLSSKFMTSPYGYTFMVRLSPTIVLQTVYLSIFLTLFNDEYNSVLHYPFSYNMYFALWDQSNQNKHIIYVLKPDPNSPAFVRPTSDKNEEFGIIQFCLLKNLTDPQSIYVKDGVFFIRIFVDFFNLGKSPFQSDDYSPISVEMTTTTTM